MDPQYIEDVQSIKSIHALQLDFPPSCIEFCEQDPEYFVIGTYFLAPREDNANSTTSENDGSQEDTDEINPAGGPQQREGSLILFKLEGDQM